MRHVLVLCAVGCALTSSPHMAKAGEELDLKTIIPKIEARYREMNEKLWRLQGAIDVVISQFAYKQHPPRVIHRRSEYYLNAGLLKLEISAVPPNDKLSVLVQNHTYRFAADKEVLSNLHLSFFQKDLSRESKLDYRVAHCLSMIFAAEYIEDFPLLDVLSSPLYSEKSARAVEVDNKPYLRIDLTVGRREADLKRAWAVLNHKHNWEIVEWCEEFPTYKHSARLEYQDDVSEASFPKRITYSIVMNDGTPVEKTERIYTRPQPCDAKEADFTLASYGLHEIGSYATLRTLLRICGPIALLVFFILAWRYHRRTAGAIAP